MYDVKLKFGNELTDFKWNSFRLSCVNQVVSSLIFLNLWVALFTLLIMGIKVSASKSFDREQEGRATTKRHLIFYLPHVSEGTCSRRYAEMSFWWELGPKIDTIHVTLWKNWRREVGN